jgi:peptide/nickel transport system substrate-binding protein
MLDLNRRRFLQVTGLGAILAGIEAPHSLAADSKVLHVRSRRDIQVLDPGWMIGGMEIDLQYACLASLAVFVPGDPLSWRPSAFVESVQATSGTTIEFKLKPGIQWSGGFGELTAEDVKFSYERIANPANKAPWKDKWGVLDKVEVTDKYSGVIRLREPFAAIWFTTICDGPGCIVSKAAVEKAGGKFTTEFPATCGPYVISKWVPNQYVALASNPAWSGPKPVYDNIEIRIVEDVKSAEIAFDAHELDLTEISLESVKRFRGNAVADAKLFEGPGLNWIWLGMNTEYPQLKDVRVRRAIQNAVDVEAIIASAYAGIAERSRGIVCPGLIGHRTKTAFEKPNLEEAKKLLSEAGASGLTLELKVLNQAAFTTAAQVVQANLAEIGITVKIVPLDAGPFWNLGLESAGTDWKTLQLYIQRFGDAPDPSQMAQWYVSSQGGVWNWERWKNPEYDELYAKALKESDTAKRAEMYLRMQDIMEETGAYVWIAHEPAEIAYRNTLTPLILPPDHRYYQDFKRSA